jgi:excisionase family DNA binding protein
VGDGVVDNNTSFPYDGIEMVTLEGMITVAEAARRLNRSIEQVRRYLREGKLRGQRIGGQWFVEEKYLTAKTSAPLIPPELVEQIRRTREEIRQRAGHDFDVVEMIRRSREAH